MRDRLPGRRPSVTATAPWPPGGDNSVHVSPGFDRLGRVKEIFARAARPDTDLDHAADDAAVMASLALQLGATLGEIAHSLGRAPGGAPSSLVGFVVDVALRLERELLGPALVGEGSR